MNTSLRRVATLLVLLGSAISLPIACGDSGDAFPGDGGGGSIVNPGCEVSGQQCPVLCDLDLGCVECLTNADCGASQPACVAGACEECGTNADCATGQSCFPQNHTCEVSCTGNADCPQEAPICDDVSGACVGCIDDNDCAAPTPICSTVTKQCVECGDNADCGAAAPICDLQDGECQQCLVDADCPAAEPACISNHCAAEPCPPTQLDCPGDGCIDPSTDPGNCGGCGIDCGAGGECISGNCECGAGLIFCDGAGCVDASTDPNHCGGCTNDCSPGQDCISGNCECAAGTIDCGGNCADTSSDPNHCGDCATQCGEGEYCSGTCVCQPGLTDVNGNCVDLQSDPNDCGGNGPCDVNAPLCQDGVCVADCSGNNVQQCGDGSCVDTDTSNLHCGDCFQPCGADEVCVNGNCDNWDVAVGCNACPCDQGCTGDMNQCCSYPGDATLIICVEGDCP